jgi:hypothetical protein
VHRTLTIRTDPPGATVYINDQLKGTSPLTYDFVWYGAYRLTLRKDGYQRLDDRKMLRAPLYLWIPLDLVMELLPLRVPDHRTWSYALTPTPELPTPMPPSMPPAAAAPTAKPALSAASATGASSDAAR